MRKKILAALVSSIVLAVALISFGSSYTGLFYAKSLEQNQTHEFDKPVSKLDEKAQKWNLIGNVSVSHGDISKLR